MNKFPAGPYSVHPYTDIQGRRTLTREDGSQWDSASITIGAGKTMLGEVNFCSNSDGYPSIQSEEEMRALAALWIAAPELLAALHEGRRAIGDHFAPNDCYATGPVTGDAFRDLVQCPACSFIAMYDTAIAKAEAPIACVRHTEKASSSEWRASA